MMMSQNTHTLQVEKRTDFGRKVRRLRTAGIIPANIYGKNLDSTAVQVSLTEFMSVYQEAGETGIVNLSLGEGKSRPVLINQVDYDPVKQTISHIDFRQVDLKEKINTHVPLELVGEAPSVKEKNAIIVQTLEELEIEALPTDIPESIQVDISVLVDIGNTISISELSVPQEVTILTDPETVVVLAQEVKEEVVTEEPVVAETEAGEVKPEPEAPAAE